MPVERELEHKSPPGRDLFPNLDDLTEEIEQVGFEQITDLAVQELAGWMFEARGQGDSYLDALGSAVADVLYDEREGHLTA